MGSTSVLAGWGGKKGNFTYEINVCDHSASVANKNLIGVNECCSICVKLLSQMAYDLQ